MQIKHEQLKENKTENNVIEKAKKEKRKQEREKYPTIYLYYKKTNKLIKTATVELEKSEEKRRNDTIQTVNFPEKIENQSRREERTEIANLT